MIHPQEFSGSNQQRHLAAKQVKHGEEMAVEFHLHFHILGIFNMQQHLSTWNRQLYFLFEGSSARDIYRP
jgi:hypothetical protein